MTGVLGDFHSHIFPAVDDGSTCVEDSLEGVGRMVAAGVSRIITTPHIQATTISDPEMFAETMADMDEAWNEVQPEVVNAFPDLDFRRGHEVMLDMPHPDLSDPRLHLGGTNFVLVEWPRLQVPVGTFEVLTRVVNDGLIPVVAHPERYAGVDSQLRVVRDWKAAGALLQGNYGSLVGRYGPGVKGLIGRLLEEGLLDYLSSDFHCRPQYELFIEAGRQALQERGGEGQLETLGSVNPGRLFNGEAPIPVAPLAVERSVFQRVRDWVAG